MFKNLICLDIWWKINVMFSKNKRKKQNFLQWYVGWWRIVLRFEKTKTLQWYVRKPHLRGYMVKNKRHVFDKQNKETKSPLLLGRRKHHTNNKISSNGMSGDLICLVGGE